ncbi:MAG: hypothetical protein GEV28_19275 [Actinophytocola sp.]|uniref:hypothetical protein n=1 Tax=Actinophytocola sp. TaxID=1872138 RepID=UPI00132AA54D|nr:hypothetical protein [Actinophytocola sp.]MPZ82420.1 hypothetical protein [Actinophytocola sp.]
MELLITAIVIGLVIYGLERNRVRQANQPNAHLAGSTDIVDRDTERISCELLFRDPTVRP